jgi:hypothetical protein
VFDWRSQGVWLQRGMPESVNCVGPASTTPLELPLPEDDALLPLALPLLLVLLPLLVPLPLEEVVDDEDEPELPPEPPSGKPPPPPLVLLHPGDAARPTKDQARQAMTVCRRMRAPLLAREPVKPSVNQAQPEESLSPRAHELARI